MLKYWLAAGLLSGGAAACAQCTWSDPLVYQFETPTPDGRLKYLGFDHIHEMMNSGGVLRHWAQDCHTALPSGIITSWAGDTLVLRLEFFYQYTVEATEWTAPETARARSIRAAFFIEGRYLPIFPEMFWTYDGSPQVEFRFPNAARHKGFLSISGIRWSLRSLEIPPVGQRQGWVFARGADAEDAKKYRSVLLSVFDAPMK